MSSLNVSGATSALAGDAPVTKANAYKDNINLINQPV